MCSRYDGDPDAITSPGRHDGGSSISFNSDAIERTLERDIDFTLTLPSVPFDHGQMIHRRLLVTVHNGLLYPTSISCVNSSTHSGAMDWEKIGFQGNDPATDLRSTGLFGLLQLVYLIEYYSAFAARLWETCNANSTEDDVFTKLPFVLIGFNFSAMLLERLRDNAFRSDFIRRARRMCATGKCSPHLRTNFINTNYLWSEFPMLIVCCEYLVGSLFLFWERWLQLQQQRGGRPPTIREFGVVKLALFSKMKSSGVQYVWDACSRARDPSAINTLPADIPEESTVPVQTDDVVCDSMCVGPVGEEMLEQKDNERENVKQEKKEQHEQEKEKNKNNGLVLGDTDEVKQ
ncbi:hypothetical protein LSM04_008870 [Trypanosoma melophagium]|nr:hypothetical protein LSM04_008870 [Trypanosoma melophagium]